MTKKEELQWRTIGIEYPDNFFSNYKARQFLKKIKKAEKRNTKPGLTSKQKFLNEYGNRLSQFETTYFRLKRFPIFLSSYHPALENQGISRTSQFIYHIENYLAEIYIFEQRAKRLRGFLSKLAIKYRCPQLDIDALTKARRDLRNSIEPLTVIRGSHTHIEGFSDGNGIDEMRKYDKAGDFTNNIEQKGIFKESAKNLLTEQRRKWKNDISNDISKCEIQMGILYTALDKLVWQIYKKIN